MRKQMYNPQVSVVIPTYNRAEDLRRCLNSLVAQTFENFEVLICDDGSTDLSRDVAEEFLNKLDLHFLADENFGGPARPRNRGIARARAPYIAFLDSDDWWSPTKLQLSVDAIELGADLVYHDLFVVRERDQVKFNHRIVSSKPTSPLFTTLLCNGMSVPNSSVVVRKELLIRIGGISENRELISIEDYDTWIRLARITEKFIRLPECLGYYWMGGGNISTASTKQIARIKVLYEQYLNQLNSKERRQAEGFLAYRIGRIAQLCGERDIAKKHFKLALLNPVKFTYRAKALVFLMGNVLS